MNKWFFTFFFLLWGNNLLFSQQLLIPLNRPINLPYENKFNQNSINFHTTSKPFVLSDVNYVFNSDSIVYKERNKVYKTKLKQYLWRKLRKESFIVVDSTDFYLTINPLFNFEIGKNLVSDSFAYVNTRGLLIQGNIGKYFSFSTSFYENQARFVNYVNDYINVTNVVPGQGPVKSFKTNDFDYSSASGYISCKPIKHLNIQLGHGKSFFGEGYRSLLLSDNAFNYPYLKFTTEFKKIQYTTMYTSFINNVSRTFVSEFPKKYATFHFLSYNINTRFNVSFFESTIWQSTKNNQPKTYSFEYLNPVIFLPAAIYKLNDSNNVMLGLNMKYKLFNKFALYAQLAIDDFKSLKNNTNFHQKIAYQFGAKGFDIFTIQNLNLIVEYNQASPYTYAYENPAQNYSHYNQSLAHPLGANFKETIGILNFRYNDFFMEVKINYALYGDDTLNSNYGKNIFYAENTNNNGPIILGNTLLQGIKTTLLIKDIRLVYLVNPATNFNLLLGISDRQVSSALLKKNSLYLYFGIRTSLTNFYYDF